MAYKIIRTGLVRIEFVWLEVEFQCAGQELVVLHCNKVLHPFDPEVNGLLGGFIDVKIDDDAKLREHASKVQLALGMDKRRPWQTFRRGALERQFQ